MTPDTSAEAVERLARLCEEANGFTLFDCSLEIAAALRALLAERDALYTDALCAGDAHRLAIAERDRLAAEVEKWKRAAVLAAAPLEAMRLAGSTYLHAEEVRSAINEGVAAVRAALAGEDRSDG